MSAAWAGVLLLIAAVACFAVLDTTTKRVTVEIPLLMAVWFRYFFQALITTALAWRQRGLAAFATARPGMQTARGLLMLVVTLTAVGSLQFMAVGEYTAIAMTTPMLVTLLAARLLGEHVSVFRLVLVGGGFAGTLLIVQPGTQSFGWAAVLPLLMVCANTAFQLLTSRLTRTENTLTIQLYTSWLGALLIAPALFWVWQDVSSLQIWLELLLLGMASAAGHILLVMAFQRANASMLMPYMYLQIGFAMLGGWYLFDHIPDRTALLGIGLISACGSASALLTLLENRLRSAPAGGNPTV